MKGHSLVGIEIIDRHPPVRLTRRGGIPGIPMGMVSIGDPSGEIVSRVGGAQARNILEGIAWIASHIQEQALQACPCLPMMDECWLETGEDIHRLHHRERLVGMLRMMRRKC